MANVGGIHDIVFGVGIRSRGSVPGVGIGCVAAGRTGVSGSGDGWGGRVGKRVVEWGYFLGSVAGLVVGNCVPGTAVPF